MNIKSLEVSLVFPHQLFETNPCLQSNRVVVMVEEYLFFMQYNFHKTKILFHRASMQIYYNLLISKGFDVEYVDCMSATADLRLLMLELANQGVAAVHYCDPVDDWLEQRLVRTANKFNIRLIRYHNPSFIHTDESIRDALGFKKRFFQTDFYIHERLRLGILLDASGKPLGGRWTYDADNRKAWPKGKPAPEVEWPAEVHALALARQWVSDNFPDNPGSIETHFPFPVDHQSAREWLQQFIVRRLNQFGPFEDAIARNEMLLNHSLLSPLLNTGLLLPSQVLNAALEAFRLGQVSLSSVEGFVRQIVGWREFIRGVYILSGRKERTTNFFGFRRKIPDAFYHGTTGILPIDQTINKLSKTAYNHHIERLMVLGNFMLLCEIDPNEVYRWFMEMYVDAFDWVMVPNVYGMSQFADGGLMSTKPYISGSRYVLSMSDYPKGEWAEVWDALFWRFIHLHRDRLRSNPRIGMLAVNFDRMSASKRSNLLSKAESFLEQLFPD
jgi:deoxyribodipyrimidine photolyase-related protein